MVLLGSPVPGDRDLLRWNVKGMEEKEGCGSFVVITCVFPGTVGFRLVARAVSVMSGCHLPLVGVVMDR